MGGRQSQAEGTGRFRMGVMSAGLAVMDGSAEKAAVPPLLPPPHSVRTGHPRCPEIRRPHAELSTDSQMFSDKDIATDTPRVTKNTLTKGHKHLERSPPGPETTPETQEIFIQRAVSLMHKHIPTPHRSLTCSHTLRLRSQKHGGTSTIHTPEHVHPERTETWILFTGMCACTHTHPQLQKYTKQHPHNTHIQREGLIPPSPYSPGHGATVVCL